MKYDCIIIGSGLAGLTVAYGLAHQGKKVAIVEKKYFGGVVNNVGSTRKKELITLADHLLQNQKLVAQGITTSIEPNFENAMRWVNRLENQEDSQHELALNQAGIKTIYGRASFVSKKELSVDGVIYVADTFVIATGGEDRSFQFPGKEYLSSSENFLTQETLPKNIMFIGAGIISFAFITIASAFHARIHVLQHNDTALRAFDTDLTERLIEINKKRGVQFSFNESIREIHQTNQNKLQVVTSTNKRFDVDKVYNVAGRVAQINKLNLENAQIDYEEQGIITNEYLQTNQENIFACGDCSNANVPKLATYAVLQAEYIVDFLMKKKAVPIHYPIQAMSTFSNPRLAQVGISIEIALADCQQYKIETIDMSGWLNAKRRGDNEALLKIVLQKSTNHLVGATAICQEADVLINYIAMGLHANFSKAELKKQIYAYPSIVNDLERFW